MAMRIDLNTKQPVLKNITGGLSGPAVFPLALRMVWQVYKAVRIPIIGLGGVSSARDVIEMMLAGATAVGVGAANLKNPFICKQMVETLPDIMLQYGVENLEDIIGEAHQR
jgi:dihydroorotate dehydrogenase (NAD+) catalytic subunit